MCVFLSLFSPSLVCFFDSVADATGNHWLQIDLGREYEVTGVVIFPVLLTAVTELANREFSIMFSMSIAWEVKISTR